jgi:hypothetical protein
MKKYIITSINEYATSQEYDRLLQIRMDKIFDTIEEYKTKHNIKCEVSDVNFGAYTKFSEEYLIKITDLISSINKDGKLWHCDFPTFWVTTMDELDKGPEIDELEILEAPISIEYKYTHVYRPYDHKKRGFDFELEDRYKITYLDSKITDEWSSGDFLELINEGAFHSEYGIFGMTPEDIKRCIEKI